MPTTLHLNSLRDIESAIDTLLADPDRRFTLEVAESLTLTIKVKGVDWDGFMDARIANYVVELQKTFERIRSEVNPEARERQLVKVQLKKGSAELIAKVADVVKNLTTNMSGTQQQVTVLVAIAVGFGCYSLIKYLEHIRKMQEEANRTRLNAAALQTLSENMTYTLQTIDPERPIRRLAKSMRSTDIIKIPSERAPLDRQEINERFPGKPRVTPVAVIIDDNYKVASIALDTPRVLGLERANISFKAQLDAELPDRDKESFVAEVKAALESGQSMKVPLRIDAKVNDTRVTEALIVGIGQQPRKGSESLD
nr:hypothetical protein [Opitutaceae bacterium]